MIYFQGHLHAAEHKHTVGLPKCSKYLAESNHSRLWNAACLTEVEKCHLMRVRKLGNNRTIAARATCAARQLVKCVVFSQKWVASGHATLAIAN
jgi:hypothetical protein